MLGRTKRHRQGDLSCRERGNGTRSCLLGRSGLGAWGRSGTGHRRLLPSRCPCNSLLLELALVTGKASQVLTAGLTEPRGVGVTLRMEVGCFSHGVPGRRRREDSHGREALYGLRWRENLKGAVANPALTGSESRAPFLPTPSQKRESLGEAPRRRSILEEGAAPCFPSQQSEHHSTSGVKWEDFA